MNRVVKQILSSTLAVLIVLSTFALGSAGICASLQFEPSRTNNSAPLAEASSDERSPSNEIDDRLHSDLEDEQSQDDAISSNDAYEDLMPCCIPHTTPGINQPCHCKKDNAPTVPSHNFIGAFHKDLKQLPSQPRLFNRIYTNKDVTSSWLACDVRLRAPPDRLYLLKCSFLK